AGIPRQLCVGWPRQSDHVLHRQYVDLQSAHADARHPDASRVTRRGRGTVCRQSGGYVHTPPLPLHSELAWAARMHSGPSPPLFCIPHRSHGLFSLPSSRMPWYLTGREKAVYLVPCRHTSAEVCASTVRCVLTWKCGITCSPKSRMVCNTS